MPRATVDPTFTQREDLKTCPPDGYVVIRKMTFGQRQHRMSLVSNMTITAGTGRRKRDLEGHLNMAQVAVTNFEFGICIADHNLEDEGGRKLDFSKPGDIAKLDPIIGEEISTLIDKYNQFDTNLDEDTPEGNF